jgi:DNA polymerase III subunit delta'
VGRTNPDVIWVEPVMKSQIIGIEHIKDVQRGLYQTSYAGGWKACVIVRADRLGDQAANAFLKTLEEPQGKCLFLLLTDNPQSIPATILSRCHRLACRREEAVASPELWEQLKDVLVAGGADVLDDRRRAMRLRTMLQEIGKAIEAEERKKATESDDEETVDARIASRRKEKRSEIMRSLLLWHRDILLLVSGAGEAALYFNGPECLAALREQASGLAYPRALRNVRTVARMQVQLEENLMEESVLILGLACLAQAG